MGNKTKLYCSDNCRSKNSYYKKRLKEKGYCPEDFNDNFQAYKAIQSEEGKLKEKKKQARIHASNNCKYYDDCLNIIYKDPVLKFNCYGCKQFKQKERRIYEMSNYIDDLDTYELDNRKIERIINRSMG